MSAPKRRKVETRVNPLLEHETGKDLAFMSEHFLPHKADAHPSETGRLRLIMTESEVMKVVERLAERLNDAYAHIKHDETVMLVGILDGVCFFFSHLMKLLDISYEIGFAKAGTYGDSQVQGKEKKDVLLLNPKFKPGQKVVLLDELDDNGRTMELVRQKLLSAGVAEADLKTCVLFSKAKSKCDIYREPDFRGIMVPDAWLVGWGLDAARQKRGWMHLYAVPRDPNLPPHPLDKMFSDTPTEESKAAWSSARAPILKQLLEMA